LSVHLVDRWCGGLDHAGNLAMLCAGCHNRMPPYSIGEVDEAIAWIQANDDAELLAAMAEIWSPPGP
jgi:5-methylcytosine-specific restriction endonuclease McrA